MPETTALTAIPGSGFRVHQGVDCFQTGGGTLHIIWGTLLSRAVMPLDTELGQGMGFGFRLIMLRMACYMTETATTVIWAAFT
jgi:hypothetical protein